MGSQMKGADQTCWRTMLLELYPQIHHPLNSLRQEDDLPLMKKYFKHIQGRKTVKKADLSILTVGHLLQKLEHYLWSKQQVCVILVRANNQNTVNEQFAIMPLIERNKENKEEPPKKPSPTPKKEPELIFRFCKSF